MSIAFSRRAAILSAAALPMIRIVIAQSRPKFIAISSANRNHGGVNACAEAVETMKAGGETLDADNSVGHGGLPNENGIVELDASCVLGPSRRVGAVGAIRNIKTPSKVAWGVLQDTGHMFPVGEGALLEDLRRDFPHVREAVLAQKERCPPSPPPAAWRGNSGRLCGFAHYRRRPMPRSGCRFHRAAGKKICASPELIQL